MQFKKYTVFPGQYIITSVPSLIGTVLGSCVSICLWDRDTNMSGMNHYLLPGTEAEDAGNANRGITSIPLLIRSLINRGASPASLDAKIFGGCNSLYRNHDHYKVGERNASIAFDILRENGIRIVAHHVGGEFGRKIVFNTTTGKVRMRLLVKKGNSINDEIDKGFGY